jgi:hypothetical protein
LFDPNAKTMPQISVPAVDPNKEVSVPKPYMYGFCRNGGNENQMSSGKELQEAKTEIASFLFLQCNLREEVHCIQAFCRPLTKTYVS